MRFQHNGNALRFRRRNPSQQPLRHPVDGLLNALPINDIAAKGAHHRRFQFIRQFEIATQLVNIVLALRRIGRRKAGGQPQADDADVVLLQHRFHLAATFSRKIGGNDLPIQHAHFQRSITIGGGLFNRLFKRPTW